MDSRRPHGFLINSVFVQKQHFAFDFQMGQGKLLLLFASVYNLNYYSLAAIICRWNFEIIF